ncbi:hypothetical protein [Marinitenerispora sediminis]|uniref:Uncharacterized protein n=1 Tax=Marinitenerispora sediminis TaxID=1931232 RepID=A0A368T577_9ACTN|nr:hypothetical protein [Marinitenerispora sediminis]RCV50129.1 hypothetical protein DEF28_18960 [Marinitenerispora sediminis]RCV54546.1 hypothetical protein DEF23_15770 [Marinitenerispora sediminis]RCV58789.1 hypothetical protein DEF24_12200 [Marinitenerispora sediminis]
MSENPDLYELRLGVYGTPDEVARLAESARGMLGQRARGPASALSAWALRVDSGDQPIEPAAGDEVPASEMTVAEMYDDLPQQWRDEHPGEEPGAHTTAVIRAGVLAPEDTAYDLLDALQRLACPDPEHSGPCPIPWQAGLTPPGEEDSRAYLGYHYGHLRGGGPGAA